MTASEFLKARVVRGRMIGRKIKIPTINLDNPAVMDSFAPGVYEAQIRYRGKILKGSLYYGPRTYHREKANAIEIHLFDFEKTIYGEEIEFLPGRYLRPPVVFRCLADMKKQIESDNKSIRSGKI